VGALLQGAGRRRSAPAGARCTVPHELWHSAGRPRRVQARPRRRIVIKRILFASDFSTITERAQEYAMELAKGTGAHVTLIHSIEPIEGAADDSYVAARSNLMSRDLMMS
jgi:hypothetical protein